MQVLAFVKLRIESKLEAPVQIHTEKYTKVKEKIREYFIVWTCCQQQVLT